MTTQPGPEPVTVDVTPGQHITLRRRAMVRQLCDGDRFEDVVAAGLDRPPWDFDTDL